MEDVGGGGQPPVRDAKPHWASALDAKSHAPSVVNRPLIEEQTSTIRARPQPAKRIAYNRRILVHIGPTAATTSGDATRRVHSPARSHPG